MPACRITRAVPLSNSPIAQSGTGGNNFPEDGDVYGKEKPSGYEEHELTQEQIDEMNKPCNCTALNIVCILAMENIHSCTHYANVWGICVTVGAVALILLLVLGPKNCCRLVKAILCCPCNCFKKTFRCCFKKAGGEAEELPEDDAAAKKAKRKKRKNKEAEAMMLMMMGAGMGDQTGENGMPEIPESHYKSRTANEPDKQQRDETDHNDDTIPATSAEAAAAAGSAETDAAAAAGSAETDAAAAAGSAETDAAAAAGSAETDAAATTAAASSGPDSDAATDAIPDAAETLPAHADTTSSGAVPTAAAVSAETAAAAATAATTSDAVTAAAESAASGPDSEKRGKKPK
eukprot:GHVU01004876.1.p1 GENE.GHVU01004876.1~~GHVU01004876.1.p1  ORF type:complete len:348 (+),score=73.89 GHVU01004876.1:493-1536(+)